MEPTINASIDAAAAALATAAALPTTATGEQTLTLVWDLAQMVSGLDSNFGVVEHVYETSHGIRPQLYERASDVGSYCPYCDTLCFVDRVLPDGRRFHMHPATSTWTLTWRSLVRTTSPQPTPTYGRRDRDGSGASVKLRLHRYS